MKKKFGSRLQTIQNPSDLRRLTKSELKEVSEELRQFIIDTVSLYGGHFAASLGVVELTTALHYVFKTPYDQLVFDVGHLAYGQKILRGSRESLNTDLSIGCFFD